MKSDINEVKKIIRALLLSTKNGLTVNELCSEYSAITSQPLPYKELGFFSAVDMIKDMPDVVRPIFLSGGVMLLRGIADSSTAHINELVRRQKSNNSYRNTKIVVGHQINKPQKLVVPDHVRNKICELMVKYPKGINVLGLEKAYTRFYGRRMDYRSFGFNDFQSVLTKCQDIVSIKRLSDKLTFVYAVAKQRDFTKASLPTPSPRQMPQQQQTIPKKNDAVPNAIKMEIFLLLSKHQLGLQASRFMFEYEVLYKKSFKLHELGFHSVIELMSRIPEIVQIQRPHSGGDWILKPVELDEKLPSIVTENVNPQKFEKNPGENLEIYISYIISPSSFWFQQVDLVAELEELMEEMNVFYNSQNGDFYTPADVRPGQVCCALYEEDQQWYRATVKRVLSKEKVLVHYVDYGNETTVHQTSLRLLLQKFYTLPFQAHQAKLSGITPNNDLWSDTAIKDFFSLTQDQHLYATVVQADRIILFNLLLNGESVAKDLADKGHGTFFIRKTPTPDDLKMHSTENVENLKDYYQKYYKALKEVSSMSQIPDTVPSLKSSTPPHTIQQTRRDQEPNRLKVWKITEEIILNVFHHNNQPFASSSEISNLFWNADILRQMLRQKGIILIKEVLSSDEFPHTVSILQKNNVKGIIDCGSTKSVMIYQITGLSQLFDAFKPKHEKSRFIVETEIQLWKEKGEQYWLPENNELSESESNAFKLQVLKSKKKRMYMSMITNCAQTNAMDEIIAIEKEISLLTLI